MEWLYILEYIIDQELFSKGKSWKDPFYEIFSAIVKYFYLCIAYIELILLINFPKILLKKTENFNFFLYEVKD